MSTAENGSNEAAYMDVGGRQRQEQVVAFIIGLQKKTGYKPGFQCTSL